MSGAGDIADLFEARASLILNLRQRGITDSAILNAFESVPHEAFVPEGYESHAYREASLPIEFGQSITAPSLLAGLIDALAPQGTSKVLEIGTGSGYSAAILARMVKRVFTLERHGALIVRARAIWQDLGISNIVGLHEDGLNGLVQQAPFDRIVLTGSVEQIPEALLDQLADGGVAVMALGRSQERQAILRVERADDALLEAELGSIRLPPLTKGRSRIG